MKLLVSVRSAEEAEVAILSGADIIDAKDPLAGALGAVDLDVFSGIHRASDGRRRLSAALGDATDPSTVEALTEQFVGRGATVVKLGFAGITSHARVSELMSAAVSASRTANGDASVVAVGYADADVVGSIDPNRLIEIAASAGARGALVDTADKRGPGLTTLWRHSELARWIARAHECELFAAVAGKLDARDLVDVVDCGADVVGVRGAACVGGRNGRVSGELVQRLVERLSARALARDHLYGHYSQSRL